MKVLTTKIAKQFGGYNLIKGDLIFAGYVFSRAAALRSNIPRDWKDFGAIAVGMQAAFLASEPTLRKGGVVCTEDGLRNQDQDDCRAFFEAGIVTYAKCFNSNIRTGLSKDIFKGPLYPNRALHEWIIEVRNQYIAHSDMQREGSIAAIQLADDINYGVRPSRIISGMQFRREVPLADKLGEMASHCDLIVKEYLTPKILKIAKEIGEQVLKMPKDQFDALPEFQEYKQSLGATDAHMWHNEKTTAEQHCSSESEESKA
jgi:hypothetical protein